MKKVFKFLPILLLLLLVGSCTPPQSTPEQTVKQYIKMVKAEEWEQIISELFYTDPATDIEEVKASHDMLLSDLYFVMKPIVESYGGIRGSRILSSEIHEAKQGDQGRSATVVIVCLYGNDDMREDTFELLERDGKWYLGDRIFQ